MAVATAALALFLVAARAVNSANAEAYLCVSDIKRQRNGYGYHGIKHMALGINKALSDAQRGGITASSLALKNIMSQLD
jgi:hypothetical protein